MTKYYSHSYTRFWEEGLLLGNGRIGVVILGKENSERISFSHHNNFLTTNNMTKVPDMKPKLEDFKNKLLREGIENAVEYFYNEAQINGYQGLRMSDIVHPSLQIDIRHDTNYDDLNYKQILDLQERSVHIEDNNKKMKTYIAEFEEVEILYTSVQKMSSEIAFNQMLNKKIKTHEIIESEKIVITQIYLDGSKITNKINLDTDGTININENIIKVLNYSYLDISVKTNYSENKFLYSDDIKRSTLKLNNRLSDKINVESLNFIEATTEFLESFYELSVYYINSYSGQGIPGLQGIWAADFNPAWSGDYTFDTNVQLAIDSYLSLGKHKSMNAVLEHILSYSEDFEINARQYFNCKGYLMPAHASTTALHVHWNLEWPLVFWFSGAGWISYYFNEYYIYTLDKVFLRDKALPFYEKTLEFYLDIGKITEDYQIDIGYSAENGLGKNPTMDIAIIKMVIKYLEKAYFILDVPKNEQIEFESIKSKLPDYLIKGDIIAEWIDINKVENHNHRHFSHFFPVFVSKEIHKGHPLFEFFRNTFIKKIDYWLLNVDQDTNSSHGKMQALMIAIALEMDDLFDLVFASFFEGQAYYKFLNTSHYENQEVFNVDAVGSFPRIIHDALIYIEHDGSITLNKIQSHYLRNGKLYNITLPNKIEVIEFEWDLQRKYVSLKLNIKKSQDLVIQYLNKKTQYKDVSGNFIYKNS